MSADDFASFDAAFKAGADEVVHEHQAPAEVRIRLDAMLRRSDRDLYVHPSTRLPGAVEIEGEIARRLSLGVQFATCYADLDHFKEFNDRYSYYEGDRVIRILAQILHDVVKGMCFEDGFVGHIGGDDFIFIIPTHVRRRRCARRSFRSSTRSCRFSTPTRTSAPAISSARIAADSCIAYR